MGESLAFSIASGPSAGTLDALTPVTTDGIWVDENFGPVLLTHEYWNPRPLVRDRRFPPVDDTRDMGIVDGRATPITR